MFRKRAKLKPGNSSELAKSSDPGSSGSVAKSQRRKKPSFINNYEDDEESEPNPSIKPLEGLKRTFRKVSSTDIPLSAAETETQHEIPFSAPSGPQILNLENLSEEEQNDEEMETGAVGWNQVPSEAEIQRIRKKRAILQQQQSDSSGTGFYATSVKTPLEHNEREYVKLLNRDDKTDLLEVIGDGRKVDQEDATEMSNDALPSGLEDSKLALSEGEVRKEENDRKRAIQNAISGVQDDEWETQQIGKIDGHSPAAVLPIPYQGDIGAESVISGLQERTFEAQNRKKILIARKVSLEAQKDELFREQTELIKQLRILSTT
ncbi:LAFA_0A02982g1_1 [Lachancea sp. 'fantastica']|nr:LAFA_0A02982g1_1 [Lachancea sp. 'fantastica']